MPAPVIIEPWFSPRIWGTRDPRPFYPPLPDGADPVGEAWLTAPYCRVAGAGETLEAWWRRESAAWNKPADSRAEFPFLIKLLFPRDFLSVQVHPDDAYAALHGLGRGKTEMWHVLAAEPGAKLALNLVPGAEIQHLAAACLAGGGAAAKLLAWHEPAPGDTYFVPAGTVHALGPGLVILEVQQPSDNTFRLDDYGRVDASGRPRELHLEAGLEVAHARTAAGLLPRSTSGQLMQCPYFQVSRWEAKTEDAIPLPAAFCAIVPVAGQWRLKNGPRLPLAHAAILPAQGGQELIGTGAAIQVSPGVPGVTRSRTGSPPVAP